ncbi:uncharacterized protein AtWU_01488 [Aspergillus tubingensis]|uniref:uncharacterized protein n=1 Tax=Aspergillus tubingensis TaxID=5068 RepID=UPI0015790FEF|nr:uncharacterized protein AtWU_01488 [Aspergillus tubingensis]GFN11691.1 hypothetical protein AtWU_01488 [Aspergillus tubingensis]
MRYAHSTVDDGRSSLETSVQSPTVVERSVQEMKCERYTIETWNVFRGKGNFCLPRNRHPYDLTAATPQII